MTEKQGLDAGGSEPSGVDAPVPESTGVAANRWGLRRVAHLSIGAVLLGTAATLVATGLVSPTDVLHNMDTFARHHGVAGVAAGVGSESAGLPLPGETILTTVSGIAGHAHNLRMGAEIIGASFAAAVVGDNVGYGVGRLLGNPVGRRLCKKPKREADLKVGRYLFREYGGRVVFFGRFVGVLRTYAAFLAGANQMPWLEFVKYNTAAVAAWSTVYGVGGYVTGDFVSKLPHPVKWGLYAVVGTAAVTGIFVMKKKWAGLQEKANAMFPGPLYPPKAERGKPNQPSTPEPPGQTLAA